LYVTATLKTMDKQIKPKMVFHLYLLSKNQLISNTSIYSTKKNDFKERNVVDKYFDLMLSLMRCIVPFKKASSIFYQ
jgi:hypothetical protein